MTSSQGKEGPAHDTTNVRRPKRLLVVIGAGAVLLAVLLVVLVFLGYRQPELLLEFANLRYCG